MFIAAAFEGYIEVRLQRTGAATGLAQPSRGGRPCPCEHQDGSLGNLLNRRCVTSAGRNEQIGTRRDPQFMLIPLD